MGEVEDGPKQESRGLEMVVVAAGLIRAMKVDVQAPVGKSCWKAWGVKARAAGVEV